MSCATLSQVRGKPWDRLQTVASYAYSWPSGRRDKADPEVPVFRGFEPWSEAVLSENLPTDDDSYTIDYQNELSALTRLRSEHS